MKFKEYIFPNAKKMQEIIFEAENDDKLIYKVIIPSKARQGDNEELRQKLFDTENVVTVYSYN